MTPGNELMNFTPPTPIITVHRLRRITATVWGLGYLAPHIFQTCGPLTHVQVGCTWLGPAVMITMCMYCKNVLGRIGWIAASKVMPPCIRVNLQVGPYPVHMREI